MVSDNATGISLWSLGWRYDKSHIPRLLASRRVGILIRLNIQKRDEGSADQVLENIENRDTELMAFLSFFRYIMYSTMRLILRRSIYSKTFLGFSRGFHCFKVCLICFSTYSLIAANFSLHQPEPNGSSA
jgi:hypothetical protein